MKDTATESISSLAQCFNFEQFQVHLQGLAGGDRNEATARAIVADVHRFFDDIAGSSQTTCTISQLLNKQNIQNFYTTMKQDGKAATTIAEKLRRMKEAVRFIQLSLQEDDTILYMKAQKVLDFIATSIKKMAKQIKMQRHKHAIEVANELPSMHDPSTMLKSNKLKEKIKHSIRNLETSFNEDDAKLLTAYCTGQILFRNSQRSGVIQNVKVREYMNKTIGEEGKPVIKCLEHKTGPDGPAQLVVSKLANQLLDKYYNLVRTRIIPQNNCEQYFFLTTSGGRYTQVYRRMARELKKTGIKGIEIPTPSQYRIMVGTESAATMDDADYRVVAKHLGHSTATQRRYYEVATCDGALTAYRKIDELAKKRVWPDEDTTTLLSVWPLTKKIPPPTNICTHIQRQLNKCRTTTNIVEKWRYLKSKE